MYSPIIGRASTSTCVCRTKYITLRVFRKFSAFCLEIVIPLPPIQNAVTSMELRLWSVWGENNSVLSSISPCKNQTCPSSADKLIKNVCNGHYITIYKISYLRYQKETISSWWTFWWDFKEQRFRSFLIQISVKWWRTMLQPTFKKNIYFDEYFKLKSIQLQIIKFKTQGELKKVVPCLHS